MDQPVGNSINKCLMCDIPCINGFPLYWWCQCGILDHYEMWPDVSCHDILMNVWREMLEAPPGTRVSNRALRTRISVS